jgi:hypothetical protein
MAKRKSLDALLSPKLKPEAIKAGKDTNTTKTTIALDGEDRRELDRIQDLLRDRGIRVREITQLIRVALRMAGDQLSDAQLSELAGTLAERWKRGG